MSATKAEKSAREAQSNPFANRAPEIVTITPELASDWLARNSSNRPLREYHVNKIARQIENDEWVFNGETIKFNTKGELIDGQHRLAACIMAMKPIQSIVIYNAPDNAFETIDIGKRRSISDALEQRGEVNTLILSSVLSLLWKYERGKLSAKGSGWYGSENTPTTHESLTTLEKHPGVRESIREVGRGRSKVLSAVAPLAACHYILTHILHDGADAEDAAEFFRQLNLGVGLEEDSPVWRLRERLIANRTARQRLSSPEIMAITFKAWNAWRDGRSVRQLAWRGRGDVRETFPIPE